jgi:type II secretory ATPase GspE/PulE/Tfp pilus assembly ATPase PilB-like protein
VEKMLREPSVALAIVYGPGGAGKTLSVFKALHDYMNEQECLAGALMPGDFPIDTA